MEGTDYPDTNCEWKTERSDESVAEGNTNSKAKRLYLSIELKE